MLGGSVSGGFTASLNLSDLDAGNLKVTTDFRSVYASVLEKWVGAPSDDILGQHYAPIEGLLG